MLCIFLDTETTGLDPLKHRILEIAFKIYDTDLKKVVQSYESVINQPAEVLAEASPESMQINGFTEGLILTGKSEHAVSAEVIEVLNQAKISEGKAVFICQNPSFDRSFFNQLVGVDLQSGFNWPYHWLDLASMFWALKDGEIKEESELSKNGIAAQFSLEAERMPHRAMNGTIHLIQCYFSLFHREVPELETDAKLAR